MSLREIRDARRFVSLASQDALASHDESSIIYENTDSGTFALGLFDLFLYCRRIADGDQPTPTISVFTRRLAAIVAEHRMNSVQLRQVIGDIDLDALRNATDLIAHQYYGHVRDGVLLPIEDQKAPMKAMTAQRMAMKAPYPTEPIPNEELRSSLSEMAVAMIPPR